MAWIRELNRLFLLLYFQFKLLGVLEVLTLQWNLWWHKGWCWIVLQVGEFSAKGAPNVLRMRLWAACQSSRCPILSNESLSERNRGARIMLVCMSLIDNSLWCLLLLTLMVNRSRLLLMLSLLLHHCLLWVFRSDLFCLEYDDLGLFLINYLADWK